MFSARAAAGTLAAFIALLGSSRAEAAASCTISTVGVAFGTYNPQSTTALDGVGSVTATCSGNTATLVLSAGTGQSGSYSARVMNAGSFSLNYNLYTTSTRNVVWGNGSAGTATRTLPASGTYTIYGRIPALQNVGAGSYTDTVVVTLTF